VITSAAVVGAGFGGIAAAIELRRAGVEDIVVLERGEGVGGVWHHNRYPGAACDVPSHLYSYSFARNPRWGRRFAQQDEIRRYLEDTAHRHGVLANARFGTEVTAAAWDEDRWRLDTTSGPVTADLLVAACGQLTRPAIPDLPGREQFAGPAFHSAGWRHDVDLCGARVGVVGTGASAIQFVPEIAPLARSLTVFQRTPAWILPKPDRAYGRIDTALFERVGLIQIAERFGWWALLESAIAGFVGRERVLAPLAAAARAHLRHQVRDPELRAKLTPTYRIGCKRILLSNDWYPALMRPNVEVVTDRIARVEGGGIVLADGSRHDLDVLIWGTGFRTREFVAPMAVYGRHDHTLAQEWADIPHAWHGLSVPGFPNFFLMYGPNTFGGSGSAIYMLESQARHIGAAARALRRAGAATIELRHNAHAKFMAELRQRQQRTVWATGGCASWYVDDKGRDPTNWPGYTFEYRRRTARVRTDVYELAGASA
jgi:cation diffusion facilitator CzcD-associated flavoprotein CzcO